MDTFRLNYVGAQPAKSYLSALGSVRTRLKERF